MISIHLFQCFNLALGRPLSSRYDCPCVSHPSAGRGGDAGDKRDDRLRVGALCTREQCASLRSPYILLCVYRVLLHEELCRPLLCLPSDLSDHDDALRLGVVDEEVEAVDEVGPVERVPSDSHAQGLAQAHLGGLVDGLVGQGPGTGDDADAAALVDVTGHDADLALRRGLEND